MSTTKRNPGIRFLLEEIRKRKGLSQVKLAKATGMTAQAICDLEKGRAGLPNDYNLVALCRVLEVQPGELIVLADEDTKNN